jgi:hypothetical protein
MKHCHRTRVGLVTSALALVAGLILVGPRPAKAAGIDITGTWNGFTFDPVAVCDLTIVQTGGTFSASGLCGGPGGTSAPATLTGAINTSTGALAGSGAAPPYCTSLSGTGTASMDGSSVSGTYTCSGPYGSVTSSFSGTRTTTATPLPSTTRTRTPTRTPTPTSMATPKRTPTTVVTIQVGSAAGGAGDTVTLPVSLSTGGWVVAGTQNDIAFAGSAPIQAKTNGKPDCTVNPDIGKEASSFSFHPSGCTPGTDCTGIRAIILSVADPSPIPDGSVLYTCKIKIGAGAPTGIYPLTCSNPGATNPKGAAFNGTDKVCSGDGLMKCNKADGTPDNTKCTLGSPPAGGTCSLTQTTTLCTSGQVVVGAATNTPITTATATPTRTATQTPTRTATHTPTRTPTPTPVPAAVALGSATGVPNNRLTVSAALHTMGNQVSATRVDIGFEPDAAIRSKADGKPDCAVNAAIGKEATSFAFRPSACTPGTNCTAIEALVASLGNTDPIADGSTLFTCTVAIGPTAAPGSYALRCSGVDASNSLAQPVPAICTDGAIAVKMACPGDCDGDGEVTVSELLTGVNILLGNLLLDECPAFDENGDQEISVSELVQGVLDAINGCPPT